jgi:hypothetical protein
MLSISFVSAYDSGWNNVKDYDSKTKTFTISDSYLVNKIEIGSGTLITPQINYVGAGKDIKVAEFSIDLKKVDYQDFLSNLRLIDLNNGSKEVIKDYTLKYKIETEISVDDYRYECKENKGNHANGSAIRVCEYKKFGKKTISQERWEVLPDKTLKKGKITLGIFTDVSSGETIEWIPTFFGREIPEWATWTSSLNDGLVIYYNMTKLDMNITDLVAGKYNFTARVENALTLSVTNDGLIGVAYNGTLGTSGGRLEIIDPFINNFTIFNLSNTGLNGRGISLSVWAKPIPLSTTCTKIFEKTWELAQGCDGNGDSLDFTQMRNSGADYIVRNVFRANNWTHIVIVVNDTASCFYINGTLESCDIKKAQFTSQAQAAQNLNLGVRSTGASNFLGMIDEMGWWNRTLSASEVTQLYNDHLGISYYGAAAMEVSVVLDGPVSGVYVQDTGVTFNATITSTSANISNATLYVWNATAVHLITTNALIIGNTTSNITFTNIPLRADNYGWNILGCGANATGSTCNFALSNNSLYVYNASDIINILSPTTLVPFANNGLNVSLNYTIKNPFTQTCYFTYSSLNYSLNCTGTSSTFLINNSNFLTIFVNNSAGTTLSKSINWTYGLLILNSTRNGNTFETANENFSLTLNITSGSQISVPNLIYKNKSYPALIFYPSSNIVILSKSMDIPLNINQTTRDVNSFFFNFTYSNGTGTSQYTTSTDWQNASAVLFNLCNLSNTLRFVNFTSQDEKTNTYIPISFKATFYNWLGTGQYKKNISHSDPSVSNYSFAFCANTNASVLKTDADIYYQADTFSPNEYHLRGAALNNITTNITLYSLSTNLSIKFYVTIKNGVTFLTDTIVIVSKYIAGEGVYKTESIKFTDNNAQFPLYAELDTDYRFSIIQKGISLGTITQRASCSAAPCTIQINLQSSSGNAYEGYYDTYATNIYSNLSFDRTTKVVSYSFLDVTGLAQYFRLLVTKTVVNGSVEPTICDSYSYTSSGTINCNLTGYDGGFKAYSYISRSPEKIDKFLTDLISDNGLGLMGVFLTFAILVTAVIGAATVSRGSPTTVLVTLGAAILLLKMVTIFPFNWTIVSLMEVVLIFFVMKTKT